MNAHGIFPWLAVALGGSMGACLRYATALWVGVPAMPAWPWATFAVNLAGSFLFGFLAVMLASLTTSELWRLALMTFSTFSFELVRLLESRSLGLALGYAAVSVVACVSLAGLGLAVGRLLFES